MWRFALLAPLLAARSLADQPAEKYNGTSTALSSSASQSSLDAKLTSSTIILVPSETKSSSRTPSSSRSLSSTSSLLSSSPSKSSTSGSSSATQLSASSSSTNGRLSSTLTSSSSSSSATTVGSTTTKYSSSLTSQSKLSNSSNSTRLSSTTGPSNSTTTGLCTGCVLQAQNPITTFFNSNDKFNKWTSVVVTATIVTSVITYNDTIVTESQTVNQTKTLVLADQDETITLQTPTFRITPTPGVFLTVDAGPTYVIYRDIYGGLDRSASAPGASICGAAPTQLKNWQPQRKEDWNYFIQTFKQNQTLPKNTNNAVPVPSQALQYLQKDLAIQSQFHGSDIATCTLSSTAAPDHKTMPVFTLMPYPTAPQPQPGVTMPNAPEASPRPPPAPLFTVTTGTFLSTTYASTVTHVTRAGCLRCQDTVPAPVPTPPDEPIISNKIMDAPPGPTPNQPDVPQPSPLPDGSSKPDESSESNNQRPPSVPVVIGDSTYTVHPVKQTPPPGQPSEQDQPPPAVVIGSQTLTPGQSTTINGVPVFVPLPTPGNSGPRIVVNGDTINVPSNSSPTGAPILLVGSNTITANPQGQFVVGSQTLKPGGPAVTVGGSTLSLASGGGIAVVNGVTSTLQNAPLVTPAPVITVGGRVVSATVVGSSTQYVVGTQTLSPGNAITVDGVTYSIPSSGSGMIVVNGVTSTLKSGQSSFVLGQQFVTASIKDGTTSYVFSPGQTLVPGGAVTVSGTTFSMPASASGSVVVINGVTSTLRPDSITAAALTLNGKTFTATVRDGTTEFVLGQGVTLRPGEAVTMSGTTYSLDKQGTALVINGQTSSIPRGPASNSAKTTSNSNSASASTTTIARDVGNFVWSGIGGGGGGGRSSSTGGGTPTYQGGFDKWAEGLIIGAAGWLLLL